MKCLECGREFEPGRNQRNRQKYCSLSCRLKANYKQSIEHYRAYKRSYYAAHREQCLLNQKKWVLRKAGLIT